MASSTTYLNLTKPTTSENFNLSVINGNWDKIDAAYGNLHSAVIKEYTYTYSCSAGGSVSVSGSDVDISVPSGYTAIAVLYISTGNGSVVVRNYNIRASSSNQFASLLNTGSSSVSNATFQMNVLYLKI